MYLITDRYQLRVFVNDLLNVSTYLIVNHTTGSNPVLGGLTSRSLKCDREKK